MKLIPTEDGSNTVLHDVFKEHYHSIHGAIQESNHVFIQNGLDIQKEKPTLSIFEMGFGTGLNAILSQKWAEDNKINLNYNTIEAYPISIADSSLLNYDSLGSDIEMFKRIHQSKWNESIEISPYFSIQKIEGFIEHLQLDRLPKIDVIFFDAFAPQAQANLWEPSILEKMFQLLNHGGHLTTYCAKGQFKRDLKSVGFSVKGVPGPPGKREMTLAFKN